MIFLVNVYILFETIFLSFIIIHMLSSQIRFFFFFKKIRSLEVGQNSIT